MKSCTPYLFYLNLRTKKIDMINFNSTIIDQLINSFQQGEQKAFCINEIYYTYHQLSQRIQAIRYTLQQNPPFQTEVGLVANDDIDTYASILALWMEGYAYVPLHPLQPLERCLDICQQVGCETILDSSKTSRYTDFHIITTSLLVKKDFCPEYNKEISEETLTYILFTSGSTGKPKGVKISRRNIAAFAHAFDQTDIHLEATDRCLQCFDMTFDVSVQSYLMPLLHGACIYTIPHDQIKFSYVSGLMEDYQITFGAMAPSMVRMLKPYFDELYCESFRACILTAEASPLELIQAWHQRCIPKATLYNYYGPTEATIYCTSYKIPTENVKTHHGIIGIGKPFEGLEALIIDKNDQPVAQGETGEMLISGDQVTPGYWKNTTLDEQAFITLTLSGKRKRYYKTGDLCSIDAEGHIYYKGRKDTQVKINGYRIELGEIEYHVRQFYTESNAVVLAQEKEGNVQLYLFVEHTEEDPHNLIEALRQTLPQYMIPAEVIYQKKFPLNSNGKTDKNKLKTRIK